MHFPDALAFAGASKPRTQVRQNDIGTLLRYEFVAQESSPTLAFRASEFDVRAGQIAECQKAVHRFVFVRLNSTELKRRHLAGE
jgi:hypothetical protein